MLRMEWRMLAVLVLVGSTWADDTTEDSLKCHQINAQESLDLDGIMGKWYVVQVLSHKREPIPKEEEIVPVVIDSCPIIKLKSDERDQLRLLWTEDAGDVEYTFHVADRERRPGRWTSTVFQNGTMTRKKYTQFAGSVHVMKAVGNHMVLTFCSGNQDGQLYSLLMSREHILDEITTKGVCEMLRWRQLYTTGIRATCAKGGTPSTLVSLLVLGLCGLASLTRLL